MQSREVFFKEEHLTRVQQLNERILTGLRTTKGINLQCLNKEFDVDLVCLYEEFINLLSNQGLVTMKNGMLKPNPKGFLIADEIALQLFFHE